MAMTDLDLLIEEEAIRERNLNWHLLPPKPLSPEERAKVDQITLECGSRMRETKERLRLQALMQAK